MRVTSFDLFIAAWNHQQGLNTPHFHTRLARWLAKGWRLHHRRLVLQAFRGSGKSTLTGLFCAWLLTYNPDLRILVVSADQTLATHMVRHVRRILETHPLTTELLPARKEEWAADRLTVARPMTSRDPSLRAIGLGGNMTGARADIIICDDVEVPKTCDTAWKRQLLRQRLQELDFILTPFGLIAYIGTPHHEQSIYSDRDFIKDYRHLSLPLIDQNGNSQWPERFPLEVIDRLRQAIGPRQFDSQMQLKPMRVEASRLESKDLVFYDTEITVQTSRQRTHYLLQDTPITQRALYWDPAFAHNQHAKKGDLSCVAFVLMGQNGRFYVHDLVVLKPTLSDDTDSATQQCLSVLRVMKQHDMTQIMLENNGIGQFLPGLLTKLARQHEQSCHVTPVHNTQQKNSRLLSVYEPLLAAKHLHVHTRLKNTPFLNEMQDWNPARSDNNDDCLDAVAGAIAHLRPASSFKQSFYMARNSGEES